MLKQKKIFIDFIPKIVNVIIVNVFYFRITFKFPFNIKFKLKTTKAIPAIYILLNLTVNFYHTITYFRQKLFDNQQNKQARPVFYLFIFCSKDYHHYIPCAYCLYYVQKCRIKISIIIKFETRITNYKTFKLKLNYISNL